VKFIGNTASEGHTTYVIKARTEEIKKCMLVETTIFLPVIFLIGDKFRWSKLEHPKAEFLDLKHWKSLLGKGLRPVEVNKSSFFKIRGDLACIVFAWEKITPQTVRGRLLRRYRELRDLNDELKLRYPDTLQGAQGRGLGGAGWQQESVGLIGWMGGIVRPQFPAKRFFGNNDPSFIASRQARCRYDYY